VSSLLPVHGFVLAGGKSSRMGVDKAMLPFRRRPMVEIAVEKLRGFCADVSIAGNRDDLARFAPIVPEDRLDAGPSAGIEAGLKASRQDWALFLPVDVPLVPPELLRRWAELTLQAENEPNAETFGDLQGSYLISGEQPQPTFCLLRRQLLPIVTRELDLEHRSPRKIFEAIQQQYGVAAIIPFGVSQIIPTTDIQKLSTWFANINTPQDLLEFDASIF